LDIKGAWKMKKMTVFMMTFFTAITFYGCGGGSNTVGKEDYEIALYQAYSTTKPFDPMNNVAVRNINIFIEDIQGKLEEYYAYCITQGTTPVSTINLSNPPAGFTSPANVTGTISTVGIYPAITLTANLSLDGYNKGSTLTMSYKGKVNANANTFNVQTRLFNKMTITVPTLEITLSGTDETTYKKVTYLSYSIGIDNSSTNTIYSLTGGFSVDSSSYSYKSYSFQNVSSTMTVSGQVMAGDFRFSVVGNPGVDSSGVWISGSLALGYIENSDDDVVTTECAVTLSTTSANFKITDGDEWDLNNWFNLKLTP
jgi:hypothetical protein